MPQTLGKIAQIIGAVLHGDPACEITGVAALGSAVEGQLTFLANRRYSRLLKETRASAVILGGDDLEHCPVNAVVAEDPYLAYVKAARYLHPAAGFEPGIHPAACVHSTADIAPGVYVGPTAVVGARSRLAANVYVGAGCVIEEDVIVGRDTRLDCSVVLCRDVHVGERTLLHPGVVIGADGFGLARESGTWLKIPQLGAVVIGDDVEIGSNTAIDRGALENTVIEDGVKIDNLVQIGHNTRVGAHTAIAGSAVIAGSVIIGRCCMIGGAAVITGHIEIADDVVLTGSSAVPNTIRKPGVYSSGMPVTENRTWRRNIVRFKHLDELARKVLELEREVERLRRERGS